MKPTAEQFLDTSAGPHPTIGLNAKRGCTDCWCTIVFILMWGLMIAVAAISFSRGNPYRLLYGTDYMGNICGQGDAPEGLNIPDWSERTLLWYPITFDPIRRQMIITDAIDLGVCVKRCPQRSDVSITVYQNASSTSTPITYPILFNSESTMYRCMPDFLTFDCANVTDCFNQLSSAASQFSVVNDAVRLGQEGFREVINGWWVIAVGVACSFVISFLWVFTLRRTVKPLVVIFILLVLLLLIGGSVGCGFQYKYLKDLDQPASAKDTLDIWLAACIILGAVAFILLCVLVYAGRTIMIACDVIEESAKVPISIPTMNLVPLCIFVGAIPFAIFAVIVAVFIQSCGNTLVIDGYIPVYVNGTDFSDVASLMQNTSAVEQYYKAHTYTFENWRIYAHLYNLFMFLWTFGLLNAIGFFTFALCTVFWYWSKPGDDKRPPIGAVFIAIKMSVCNHLGSLAIGSFLVAVVQLMRVILVLIEKKAKETGADQQAQVKFILRVAHCILACLERVIKFINKNAYIMMAHDGTNFISSAMKAFEVLSGNKLTIGFTYFIAELFFFFGKLQIALFSGGITFLITYKVESAGTGITKGIILIVIVTLIAYLVATLFLSVLACCVDSMLICFCYDKIYSEVDYFPQDLAKHVDIQLDSAKVQKKNEEMASAQAVHSLPLQDSSDML